MKALTIYMMNPRINYTDISIKLKPHNETVEKHNFLNQNIELMPREIPKFGVFRQSQHNAARDANGSFFLTRLLMLWTKTAIIKVLYNADTFRVRPIRSVFVEDGIVCLHQ